MTKFLFRSYKLSERNWHIPNPTSAKIFRLPSGDSVTSHGVIMIADSSDFDTWNFTEIRNADWACYCRHFFCCMKGMPRPGRARAGPSLPGLRVSASLSELPGRRRPGALRGRRLPETNFWPTPSEDLWKCALIVDLFRPLKSLEDIFDTSWPAAGRGRPAGPGPPGRRRTDSLGTTAGSALAVAMISAVTPSQARIQVAKSVSDGVNH